MSDNPCRYRPAEETPIIPTTSKVWWLGMPHRWWPYAWSITHGPPSHRWPTIQHHQKLYATGWSLAWADWCIVIARPRR